MRGGRVVWERGGGDWGAFVTETKAVCGCNYTKREASARKLYGAISGTEREFQYDLMLQILT